MANVVLIPKNRPAKSIENDVRPISLTPTISKILESFVGHWLLGEISTEFDNKQFGGLKGRSTTHALVDVLHTYHEAADKKLPVRSLFIDYSKAFDTVDHSIVLNKLSKLEIDPALMPWLTSFLSKRQQRGLVMSCLVGQL